MTFSLKHYTFHVFGILLLGACSGSSSSNDAALSCAPIVAGDETSMNAVLSTMTTIENLADNISANVLTIVGDSYSTTQSGFDIYVTRSVPGLYNSGTLSIGGFAYSLLIPADVYSGTTVTTIDHDIFASDPNPLADYYAPSDGWASHLVAYREIDSTNTSALSEISSLNNSEDTVSVTLPCDTSSCTVDCTCQCYHWNFTTNRWTQEGLTTTQGSSTTSCSSYLPSAYVSVFAVPNGCE